MITKEMELLNYRINPLSVTRSPSPTTHHPPPVTRHPPPATRYAPPVTCYPLPVTRYPQPAEKTCRVGFENITSIDSARIVVLTGHAGKHAFATVEGCFSRDDQKGPLS